MWIFQEGVAVDECVLKQWKRRSTSVGRRLICIANVEEMGEN